VALNRKKKVVIERHVEQPGIWLEKDLAHQFGQEFVHPNTCLSTDIPELPPQGLLNEIRSFESFNPGLTRYY